MEQYLREQYLRTCRQNMDYRLRLFAENPKDTDAKRAYTKAKKIVTIIEKAYAAVRKLDV